MVDLEPGSNMVINVGTGTQRFQLYIMHRFFETNKPNRKFKVGLYNCPLPVPFVNHDDLATAINMMFDNAHAVLFGDDGR